MVMILIKTPTITFSLEVELDSLISNLYDKVAERSGQKRFQFSLLYAGEVLSNSTSKSTIGSNGIKKESTIHMVLIKEFKLVVTFADKTYNVEIPNNDGLRISHLKTHIKTKALNEIIDILRTPGITIELFKNAILLSDNSSLHSTLNNGDSIEMKINEPKSVKSKMSSKSMERSDDCTDTISECDSSDGEDCAISKSKTTYKQKQQEKKDEEVLENEDELLKNFIESSISNSVEIVFCFDTTGSMSSIIQSVKNQVVDTINRLMKDIPDIKIGIMGLGDYDDGVNVLTVLDLSSNVKEIVEFIRKVPGTSGGDAPEAYEYALYRAKTLSWSTHTSKALVMIGDECPHPPSYTDLKINWFKECDDLFDMGIKIYGVKALSNQTSGVFYEELAERTGGICINFKSFNLITKMFLTICYREASKEKFKEFTEEIKNENDKDLNQMLDDLNQENFKVVKAEDIDGANKNTTTTTTTTTTSPNNNNNNVSVKKVIVKKYGVPTTIKVSDAWYDHRKDLSLSPSFIFSPNEQKFVRYHELSSVSKVVVVAKSRCDLM